MSFALTGIFTSSRVQQSVWPGEQVVAVLDDFETHWKRGRMSTLQSAVELVFWTLINKELDKV